MFFQYHRSSVSKRYVAQTTGSNLWTVNGCGKLPVSFRARRRREIKATLTTYVELTYPLRILGFFLVICPNNYLDSVCGH